MLKRLPVEVTSLGDNFNQFIIIRQVPSPLCRTSAWEFGNPPLTPEEFFVG